MRTMVRSGCEQKQQARQQKKNKATRPKGEPSGSPFYLAVVMRVVGEAQPAKPSGGRWTGDVTSREVFTLGWALARQ